MVRSRVVGRGQAEADKAKKRRQLADAKKQGFKTYGRGVAVKVQKPTRSQQVHRDPGPSSHRPTLNELAHPVNQSIGGPSVEQGQTSPQPNGPSRQDLGGTVGPASAKEKIGMSSVGEFASGFVRSGAVDDAGRDIRTGTVSQQLGFALGRVAEIAGVGAGPGALGNTLKQSVQSIIRNNLALFNELSFRYVGQIGKIVNALDAVPSVGKLSAPAKTSAELIPKNSKSIEQTMALFDRLLERGVSANAAANAATRAAGRSGGAVVDGAKATKIFGQSTGKLILKGSLVTLAVGTLGSYPWDAHLRGDNGMFQMQQAVRDAEASGDPELIEMSHNALEEFLHPDTEAKIQMAIPYVNVLSTVKKLYEGARISWEAHKVKLANEEANPTETVAESIANNIVFKDEVERARTEQFNEDQLTLQQLKLDAEAAGDLARAELYEQQKKNMLELDRRQAEWMASFWLEYNKQKLESSNSGGGAPVDSGRSNLNFGLI